MFIFLFISSFSHLNSHRLPLLPSAFQERCNLFLIILMLPVLPPLFSVCALLSLFFIILQLRKKKMYLCFLAADESKAFFFFFIFHVYFSFCQMVMMTQQVCPGCLPRPPVRIWHRPHRCPMAVATSAWPLAARKKEALVCRTPASFVTSPSGMKLTLWAPWDAAGAISVH